MRSASSLSTALDLPSGPVIVWVLVVLAVGVDVYLLRRTAMA